MFDPITRLEWRFRRIAENLRPFDLQFLDETSEITEDDLFGELTGRGQASKFLGYYSLGGIDRALRAYGIYALLQQRGYHDPQLEWDLTDGSRHCLRVYDGPGRERTELLIEFAAHIGTGARPQDGSAREPVPENITLLVIDWLTLQDPRRKFEPAMLLPGQVYPGLGIGKEIGVLIGRIARRLGLDGCMATPAWFHNALAYSARYSFVAPAVEGRFRALRRDTRRRPLHQVAWAMEWGCIKRSQDSTDHGNGGPNPGHLVPVAWEGRCQVWAFSRALVAHFRNPAYKGVRDAVMDGSRFIFDEACYRAARERHF